MLFATVCASHTPLMDEGVAPEATRKHVAEAFARLGNEVRSFDPELVIQFSPDHFNGFFYDLMPAFCLGVEAESVGDYGTQTGALPVPADIAHDLARFVMARDVDLALSLRMKVDHGFVQVWEKMTGTFGDYPLIPIFINCAAPPLPPYRRARKLGEAVGAWAAQSGKRVLFVASGGLSHDPPLPDVRTAPAATRERLINGRNPTPEMRRAHVERVLAAGAAADRGEGPCLPLDPEWDREVIDTLLSGDLAKFDAYDPETVRVVGGRGANEVMAWIAAFAAQAAAAGAYTAKLEYYEPIHGWIAGMAMMTARTAA
jgi:2,3-dihydroxyphenylpropionate 1,2-dioxygenase